MKCHLAAGPGLVDLPSWASTQLAGQGWDADGLYVATSSAGHRESVAFWAAAQETGLTYANPRMFPWTLVNGPTGSIAMAIGVRWPTYTLVGYGDAVTGAVENALDDLESAVVSRALIVAVDIVGGAVGGPVGGVVAGGVAADNADTAGDIAGDIAGGPALAAVLLQSAAQANRLLVLLKEIPQEWRPAAVLGACCSAVAVSRPGDPPR
ncbi:MAG: hypothetical protein M3500_01425, partial [Actinomycetota bacterium]|nr:hypothetical protein [Actinomycetota bacterium]